jgi:hypothetical protein
MLSPAGAGHTRKDKDERSWAMYRLRLSELDSILEELEKEGWIKIDANMVNSK